MPTQFDEAFAKVQKLAAIFESGKDRYLSSDYQEAEVRKDFIDKFFTALGWDVNHDDQTNPYAQEVKVERGVNEGSSRKRADYAFHLAPNFRDVRFYVEAKLPSAKTERDREFYTNKCATVDQEIDRLVYQLYGFTEEEIKLVEGAAK